ncbi:TPA: hypothetical protein I9507_001785 [Legionella pneumophila]|uniref:hypothetical protein n=1 Tax=Legionella pneumophila TaxID=446 RepID=UPI0007709012|nr:hypothetical protein [Legionella pneumophila]CZH70961.1 Uncharacterised protein [Legionella pneumophila]CZH78795.1 Uncharacterised protein [Legionella pneumophila]CZH79541.1 Uncharacterised protein [Legionella pneumophila]CZH79732.1 Uncharacterised protein [Legionella pneumophila]CZH87038.1 Uncharacterised protein [Legionella pneumophila]
MIDYEKLKEAHELCYKLAKQEKSLIEINYNHRVDHTGQASDTYSLYGVLGGGHKFSLDGLITKLKELTKPKPKYEVGQEVWNLYRPSQEPFNYRITEIIENNRYRIQTWKHKTDHGICVENELYPSREALIDAQIEYWKGLKQDEIVPIEDMRPKFEGEIKGFRCFDDELEVKRCEHEWEYGNRATYKCRTCGNLKNDNQRN